MSIKAVRMKASEIRKLADKVYTERNKQIMGSDLRSLLTEVSVALHNLAASEERREKNRVLNGRRADDVEPNA